MIFSKILIKLDNKDIGLQNIRVILYKLSLKGYFCDVTEILNISERMGAMILLAYFNNFMGDDHRL